MRCQHCNSPRLRFIRSMTHVDKYLCLACKKPSFFPKEPGRVDARIARRVPVVPGKPAFMVFDHQEKSKKLVEALQPKYQMLLPARHYPNVKFCLTDTDIMGRRDKLDHMRRSGVGRFFVYPHAARPDLVNDIYQEWPHTTAHFVTTEGHADVMRAFGYSRPLVPIGWVLCPQKKFKPRKEPYKVLFAPIHPRCSGVDQEVNRETFNRLAKLAKAGDIELTVRFVTSLEQSGLEKVEHPNIKYTVGFMRQGYDQIDEADVVVGHQTFLYLAVARGVPAVTMAADMPTHIQLRRKSVQWVKNWKRYEHLVAFPYDILQCHNGDTLGMLRRAVKSDCEIVDWRKRMVGYPFRADWFLSKLEKFL